MTTPAALVALAMVALLGCKPHTPAEQCARACEPDLSVSFSNSEYELRLMGGITCYCG
jgi:hypothetical protein